MMRTLLETPFKTLDLVVMELMTSGAQPLFIVLSTGVCAVTISAAQLGSSGMKDLAHSGTRVVWGS